MSREDVEVVVGQFEAVNARNFAAAMDAYAEDVTLVLHGRILGRNDDHDAVQTLSGKRAVGEWFGDWFRQFAPDYRFEIEEARDAGERVFLVATNHGRGRASGAPIEGRTVYTYTVREGKVSRVELWRDRKAALEAAGLPE
jgi:ketosteroid isomerase-like protein